MDEVTAMSIIATSKKLRLHTKYVGVIVGKWSELSQRECEAVNYMCDEYDYAFLEA